MSITNGTITFSRKVRPADFEDKTASVALSFTLPDGISDAQASAEIELVGTLARDKALALLGLQAASVASALKTIADASPAQITAGAAEVEKRHRGPNKPKDPEPAKTSAAPAADEIPGLGDVKPAEPAPEPETPAESLDDVLGLAAAEPAKEITDADLNAAVQKKNATLQDPPKIRALIVQFQPDATKPPLLANVAQGRRQEFIDALNALAK